MSRDPLTTYLLTYRKRTGLSQQEVAFLLGIDSDTTVSKHETGAHKPQLDAALSYEIILREPSRELFAGWYVELDRVIRGRAEKLLKRLSGLPPTSANTQKLNAVRRILEEPLTNIMIKPNRPMSRVLAIDPSPGGFGFAVLEDPTRLVDWGVADVWSTSPRAFLSRVEAFVDRYCPGVIILEDVGQSQSRRRQRTARRLASVVRYAASRRIAVVKVNRAQVRAAFGSNATKHDIAVAIAEVFPELAPRLPSKRKLWQSESERMNMFDAVSFALTALAALSSADATAAA